MSLEPLISETTKTIAVDAIYYVTRLIRHRSGLSGSIRRLFVEGLQNEPSLEAEALAHKLVKEIELGANNSLDNLSATEAAEVVSQLEQLALTRYLEGTNIDTERGQVLLHELRGLSPLSSFPS